MTARVITLMVGGFEVPRVNHDKLADLGARVAAGENAAHDGADGTETAS